MNGHSPHSAAYESRIRSLEFAVRVAAEILRPIGELTAPVHAGSAWNDEIAFVFGAAKEAHAILAGAVAAGARSLQSERAAVVRDVAAALGVEPGEALALFRRAALERRANELRRVPDAAAPESATKPIAGGPHSGDC